MDNVSMWAKNEETALLDSPVSESSTTAESQAVNNAIENNQSFSLLLEVKSTDRFQSVSGELSLLSAKVNLLTQ
jgi:hypothetical protein